MKYLVDEYGNKIESVYLVPQEKQIVINATAAISAHECMRLSEDEIHDLSRDTFLESLSEEQRKNHFRLIDMHERAVAAYKAPVLKKSIYERPLIKWTPDKYRDALRMWRGNQMFIKKKDIIATISIKYGVGSKRIYQVIRKAERLEKEGKL